jgi:hypothetical protein
MGLAIQRFFEVAPGHRRVATYPAHVARRKDVIDFVALRPPLMPALPARPGLHGQYFWD